MDNLIWQLEEEFSRLDLQHNPVSSELIDEDACIVAAPEDIKCNRETTVEVTPTVDSQFEDDIKGLISVYGDLRGQNIEVRLAELLQAAPRKRRRTDAYRSLQRFLKSEMDCTLTIISR